MQKYSDTVQDRNGNVVVGATVTVTTYPAGTTATVYSSDSTSGSSANPLTTDSNGYFEFWAPNGRYTLTISKTGITTRTVSNILIQDPEVTVTEYGAKGDGTTDDAAAIQSAITNSPAGTIICFPPGSYRVSTTITVPANKALRGLSWGGNVAAASAQIIGDLAVTPIVSLQGGGASETVAMKQLGVNRATGTVPASSIGVLVQASNNAVLEDVIVYRCDIGVKFLSAFACKVNRLQTTIISGTHMWIESTQEVDLSSCRFGKNGGNDVACNEYVRIKGNPDTVRFMGCQFNQSAGAVTRAIYFDTYSSTNGLISFDRCHFEGGGGITYMVAQTGTTTVDRLSFIGSSMGCSGELFNVAAATFTNLVMVGCPFVNGGTNGFNGFTAQRIVGNRFIGAVTITGGSGGHSLNYYDAGVTLAGTAASPGFALAAPVGPVSGSMAGNSAVYGVTSTAWTPTDASGAGLTLTTAAGQITLIANTVHAWGEVVYPATADGSTAKIGGLPIACVNTQPARAGVTIGFKTESTLTSALVTSAATTIQWFTATGGAITNATLSGDTVYFLAIYPIS